MWANRKTIIAVLAAVPLLAAAGCATQDEVKMLQGELQDIKGIASQAAVDAKTAAAEAGKAADQAMKAAAAAQAASDKADRILRESLRK